MKRLAVSALTKRLAFAGLSVAGLAFWFLLAFPFGNHNESLLWLVSFDGLSWNKVWTTRIEATASLRPLGQATAYYLYLLAGRSDTLVQFCNFLLAALAWLSPLLWLRNDRLYALTSLVATGAFFSGYVYLFHVHGVFYSPLLLALAFWLYQEREDERREGFARQDLAACVVALVAFAYHPYSLLLFLALLVGRALERRRRYARSDWVRTALIAAALVALVALARPAHHETPLSLQAIDGLLASYRLTEVFLPASVAAMGLVGLVVLTLPRLALPARSACAVAALMAAFVFIALGIPVLYLWIGLCVTKCLALRRLGLAALTAASALLPMIAPSGSPTYAVFAVFACAVVTALGPVTTPILQHRSVPAATLAALAMLTAVGVALRVGWHVPVASGIARPLLAEKEKTVQLDEFLQWAIASQFAADHVVLVQDVRNPADAVPHAASRQQRPPTYQHYVDAYWRQAQLRRGIAPSSNGQSLAVLFGEGGVHGRGAEELVYRRGGSFAGAIRVFRTTEPQLYP